MKNEYEGVTYEPTILADKKQTGSKNNNKKINIKDKINSNNGIRSKGNKSVTDRSDIGYRTDSESKNNKFKYIILLGALLAATLSIVILTFQSVSKNNDNTQLASGNSDSLEQVNVDYDTKTLGVIKEIDRAKSVITFYDIEKNLDQTIGYDETTNMKNKYGKEIAAAQVRIGEIVDLYYLNKEPRIVLLQASSEAWEYKGVKNLIINQANKVMSISTSKFKYTDNLVIANNDNLVNLMDINNKDELIIKGYDKKVYSIIVDKGHGYIRLDNYEDFIGGTVEVGYDIIMPVVEDMLIVASEGSYKLTMSNGTFTGTKTVNVLRDQEVTVDMGDFIKPAQEIASVDFSISPEGADLYINNELTKYEEAVKLSYGEYQIEVTLSGYDTYTGTLTVDSPGLNISINLVATDSNSEDSDTEDTTDTDSSSEETETDTEDTTDTTDSSSSGDSSSDNDESTSDSSEDTNTDSSSDTDSSSNSDTVIDENHKITVQGPKGAKVYFDGTLKGTAPITFDKVIGTHTISLTKTGYVNKSYTIEVMDDSEDVLFNFPEMALSVK